jgi:hypothetical protein
MADNDEALLGKINAAVAEHNAAERAVTTAQAELVSKSKVLGQLLLEVKKRHPKAADFEAFLKRVNGPWSKSAGYKHCTPELYGGRQLSYHRLRLSLLTKRTTQGRKLTNK